MHFKLSSLNVFKKLLLFTITTAFLFSEVKGQLREDYKASIELQSNMSSGGVVPFWMRSNNYGSIPPAGLSSSILGNLSKNYEDITQNDLIYNRTKTFDWGFGLEGRVNAGKRFDLQLIEAYAKVKADIFQLKLGRSKEVMGLNGDTTLSSGNFAISGNSLGIPKIELSIPEYWIVPLFNGLFSIKGNFSHGWVGKARISESFIDPDDPNAILYDQFPKTYFHQKSFYGRMKNDSWKIALLGGFSHQVYWGNEKAAYGSEFKLTPIETFLYVATGKPYGTKSIPRSKIGNQIGSIDVGVEYEFESVKLTVYRQNFYDVGALAKLANIKDGLNGISVTNNYFDISDNNLQWKAILFEFFSSKNQAGYPWSTKTASGDEDYYNNYYYKEGWSYKGLGMGNPLITPLKYARRNQASDPFDYFINNRVIAIHTGFEGALNDWSFKTKLTYSWNYGTFATSIYGKSTGNDRGEPDPNNIFRPVQQFSYYLNAGRVLSNGYEVGVATAVDIGRLLNNSVGFQFQIRKNIN